MFGPKPRDYGYPLPKKVVRGALRAALAQKLGEGRVMVVDGPSTLVMDEPRTKAAAERLEQLGLSGRTVLVDVKPDLNLELSVRNIPGVDFVASSRLTARDVVGAAQLVLSKASVEHLTQVLGS